MEIVKVKTHITRKKNLLVIFFFFCILTLLLITKLRFYDGFVPDWDESEHLNVSYSYFLGLNSHNLGNVLSYYRNSGTIYPPLYHILTAFNFYITKSWPLAGVLTNIYFMLLLMLSIYYLGTYIDKPRTGLLAAILTPMLPIYLTLQERSTIDFTSSALFVCSFYLLFKTKYFTNLKYSIILGFVLFLSLLTKWPFIVPSIPFIFYALRSIYKNVHQRAATFSNIAITLLISLLGITWYLFHYQLMINVLNFFWNPNGYVQILWNNPHGLNVANLLYYLYTCPITGSGVGLIVLIFFYISFWFRGRSEGEIYLVISVITTTLVLTYLDDKSPFYLIYSYPLLMIVTISGMFRFKRIFYKKLLLLTFTLSILLNFVLSQFNYVSLKRIYIDTKWGSVLVFPNYDTKFASAWPTKKVAEYVYKSGKCGGDLLVFPDHKFINAPNLRFYLRLLGANFLTIGAYEKYDPAHDITFDIATLHRYNCIVTKSGDPGIFANTKVMDFVTNNLSLDKNYNKFPLKAPDNSIIYIFTRKNVKS